MRFVADGFPAILAGITQAKEAANRSVEANWPTGLEGEHLVLGELAHNLADLSDLIEALQERCRTKECALLAATLGRSR